MPSDQYLELRIYKIHHGLRDRFAVSMRAILLPLFERHGMNVIHHGPSAHDKNSYFLIRAFSSAADRKDKLDSAFSENDWLMKHEPGIVEMIDYTGTALVPAAELIELLTERFGPASEELSGSSE